MGRSVQERRKEGVGLEQLRTMAQRLFLTHHSLPITHYSSVDEVAKWAGAFKHEDTQ